MSSLFIIGNGFDLAHGIPTKYNDFRKYIIELYPEALEFRDEIIHLEECKEIYEDEFAAEILLSAMDKVCGEDWSNFESALADINFDNKLPNMVCDNDWSEDECNNIWISYLMYMDQLTSGFINCTPHWQEFFRTWLNGVEQKIESGKYSVKKSLLLLFSKPNTQFFTFNYTKTLQKLYGIKKVIHIHNHCGQKLIFGHGENDVMYGTHRMNDEHSEKANAGPIIFSSFLDDMIMSFKKDTTSPLRKYNNFFKKLDASINQIYSYGFSYSKVDGIYIKEIIKRINCDATWFFTEFEAQDREAMRIKKIRLRNYGFKGDFALYEG